MKKLLVLHFKGGVRVSGTGSRDACCKVACLEWDDVGTIAKRGLCAERRAIQRQRGAGTVKDLYADVSRAACGRTLQGQYRWVCTVNRRASKSDRGLLGNGDIAIIQLDVEANRRAGATRGGKFR